MCNKKCKLYFYKSKKLFVYFAGQSQQYNKSIDMKIINLSEGNSLLNQYVAELRDVHVQNDRMRFRRNIERIGEIMAYEMSKGSDIP